MLELPNIISVDDHIMEPQNLWQDRLPAKWREAGPRVVRELVQGTGDAGARGDLAAPGDADAIPADVWHYEGVRVPILKFWASAGVDPSQVGNHGTTYEEMRPGCYDPVARIADMDINGVDASLCFPNLFIRFCGQRFLEGQDRELALLCVQAYNDFLVEDWQGAAPGRLFGAGIVPLWDAQLAAAEVYRIAERGIRNVCFSEIPAWLNLPGLYSGYWDPFFRACEETGSVVQMHIGSSSTALNTSPDAPMSVATVNLYVNSSLSLSDVLASGLFMKFPGLRVAYAESQAGWIPYVLERMDTLWEAGYEFNEARAMLERAPSEYYKDHVFTCIFNDSVATHQLLDAVGVDNICFETDYPHPDGTWPRSKEVAAKVLSGLDPITIEKILRTNAMRMLGIGASVS